MQFQHDIPKTCHSHASNSVKSRALSNPIDSFGLMVSDITSTFFWKIRSPQMLRAMILWYKRNSVEMFSAPKTTFFLFLFRWRRDKNLHLCSSTDRTVRFPATCGRRRLSVLMRSWSLHHGRYVDVVQTLWDACDICLV